MGWKPTDLVPIGTNGPTSITPSGKDGQIKVFQLLRTDTVATVKAVLPADATILGFMIYGAASNAGTTATISIGSTVTATEFVNGQDIKTAGGLVIPTATVNPANMPQIEALPLGSDIQVWAKYAETGTVSTLGGPYRIAIWYVR